MKKLIYPLILLVAISLASCEKPIDFQPQIDALQAQIDELRLNYSRVNENVNSLRVIVEALQRNDNVTSVTPVYEGTNVVGYTITFSKSGPITIYNNGGASTTVPVIGVRLDTDGVYYWTLNNEWLTDSEGNRVKAVGDTPQFRIENGNWQVSYDGVNWTTLGSATGGSGSSESIFQSVTWDNEMIYFVLTDGTVISFVRSTSGAIVSDTIPNTTVIYYTSVNNTPLNPSNTIGSLISNVFENGVGMMTFGHVITTITNYSFNNLPDLLTMRLPESITRIDYHAFDGSGLTSIEMPDALTSIGESAFAGTNLTSVTIPANVTEIEMDAFNGCNSLVSIYCMSTVPPTLGYNAFANNAPNRKIYVPRESLEDYVDIWYTLADDIEGYDF
ncbi:MAG: leucine-rich repeat protein [Bacteroidales bacterium]|nr:leucine-rich repeat protein [Bacteroidales bacterium]